jgi:hypothetical protein
MGVLFKVVSLSAAQEIMRLMGAITNLSSVIPPRRLLVAAFIENMKKHTLIVGNDFSIANETDRDVYVDYFPGIWAIPTQKETLRFAREILARGDSITVSDYNNPQYHRVANKFIKALGLKQKLFPESAALERKTVTSGKPTNLSELKRYLVVGQKVKIIFYRSDGSEISRNEATTLRTQGDLMVVDSYGTNTWWEYRSTDRWTFDNIGTTQYIVDNDGKYIPISRIEY